MTADAFYLLRRSEPRTDLQDLDEVVMARDVLSDAGATVPAGTQGTIVAVLDDDGAGYIVEFSEPEGTLATVDAADLRAADAEQLSDS